MVIRVNSLNTVPGIVEKIFLAFFLETPACRLCPPLYMRIEGEVGTMEAGLLVTRGGGHLTTCQHGTPGKNEVRQVCSGPRQILTTGSVGAPRLRLREADPKGQPQQQYYQPRTPRGPQMGWLCLLQTALNQVPDRPALSILTYGVLPSTQAAGTQM